MRALKGAVVHVRSKSIQGFKMEMRELLIGTSKEKHPPYMRDYWFALQRFAGLPKYDLVLQKAIRIKMF